MDLITRIRKNSGILHNSTEETGIIKRIFEGNASVDSYAEYLFNLSAMYKAIEDGIESNLHNDNVKEFSTKELYRHELIEKDLEYFLKDKENKFELCSSTIACVERIKEVVKTNPELIVAHAYTRFLADLFGGRMFIDLLTNKYNVPAEGLNYYKCDQIQDIKTYVMGYAMKINKMNLSDELQEKLLNEVSNSYIYNLAISCELETKLYSTNKRPMR